MKTPLVFPKGRREDLLGPMNRVISKKSDQDVYMERYLTIYSII